MISFRDRRKGDFLVFVALGNIVQFLTFVALGNIA